MNSIRDLWVLPKCTNIHIMGAPEGEETKTERIVGQMIAEKFSNLLKNKGKGMELGMRCGQEITE